GGSLLRSATFAPVPGRFSGGMFEPLTLEAGHRYFIGFEDILLLGGNVTKDAGATSLGTERLDHDRSRSFAIWGSGGSDDFTDQPVLQFHGTPEPSGLTLLGLGAVGFVAYVWRREKAARVA